MADVIIDCYTDEPAGLGVPPYLGVYPRYLYGRMKSPYYLTIDDLRLYKWFNSNPQKAKKQEKTNIKVYNLTKNYKQVGKILDKAKNIVIILGVHTPGNYLSALPGTIKEIKDLLPEKGNKILTGPAVYGSQLEGGKFGEQADFDQILNFEPSYEEIKNYSIKGSEIVDQIPDLRVAEIETGHGCQHGKCSYCMEPLKHKLEFRQTEDIVNEVKALYDKGIRHFRLGKQACFYAFPEINKLLKNIWDKCPGIKTLHIDNANPINIVDGEGIDKTKAIVKYTTSGNIAALGIESFDKKVINGNNLNSKPETSYQAVKIINKYGKEKGKNGLSKFLPGINILLGLNKESKQTHKRNMYWLNKILDTDLLVRRINIRKVSIFSGTPLYKMCGNKFLKKNSQYYWKWRNQIRQEIDHPMLKKITPKNTELKNIRTEIYDGKKTFGRQVGTYPLIVGINKRLPLKKFYNIKVKGHMLRSVVGEVS